MKYIKGSKTIKRFVALTASLVALTTSASGMAADLPALETRINLELSQPVLPQSTSFDFLFDGDQTMAAVGGVLPGSNPFVSAPGNAANSLSYNAITDVTTLKLAGNLTVPQGSPNTKYHAGYRFFGSYREVLDLSWVGSNISVPDVACAFHYDSVAGAVTVVATNYSTHTVSLSDPAFRVVSTFPSLENLTGTNFPLGSMNAAPILAGQLLPGQSTPPLVVSMPQDQFIVTRALITFSGASASEPYQVAGGNNLSLWSSTFVPEPHSLVLLSVFGFGFVLPRCRHVGS